MARDDQIKPPSDPPTPSQPIGARKRPLLSPALAVLLVVAVVAVLVVLLSWLSQNS